MHLMEEERSCRACWARRGEKKHQCKIHVGDTSICMEGEMEQVHVLLEYFTGLENLLAAVLTWMPIQQHIILHTGANLGGFEGFPDEETTLGLEQCICGCVQPEPLFFSSFVDLKTSQILKWIGSWDLLLSRCDFLYARSPQVYMVCRIFIGVRMGGCGSTSSSLEDSSNEGMASFI